MIRETGRQSDDWIPEDGDSLYSEAGLLPLNRNPESEKETVTSCNSTNRFGLCVSNIPGLSVSVVPVLEREGIVPRERALLRRPGREEGDALRSRGLWWWLMSLDRLGGGAGTKDSTKSGGGKRGWLLRGGAVELPARNLQHKSNATGSNMNSWPKPTRAKHLQSPQDIGGLPVLHTSTAQLRPSLECEMTAATAQLSDTCHCSCCHNKCGPVMQQDALTFPTHALSLQKPKINTHKQTSLIIFIVYYVPFTANALTKCSDGTPKCPGSVPNMDETSEAAIEIYKHWPGH